METKSTFETMAEMIISEAIDHVANGWTCFSLYDVEWGWPVVVFADEFVRRQFDGKCITTRQNNKMYFGILGIFTSSLAMSLLFIDCYNLYSHSHFCLSGFDSRISVL